MARPSRRQRNRIEGLSDVALAWFLDREVPQPNIEVYILETGLYNHRTKGTATEFWELHREALLAEFAEEHPGRRPGFWWRIESPEPRVRVGGTGTPAHEVWDFEPSFNRGIPDRWATFDAQDAPVYESQASFLKRLGLLLPGELDRLHPGDFEPEVVTEETDEQ